MAWFFGTDKTFHGQRLPRISVEIASVHGSGQIESYFTKLDFPETNSLPLKIHPWKFGDSYWKSSFLGAKR